MLFLGSSMINGGTGVANNETISAFIESSDIEAINFGTMMYSLDQSLLAYRHRFYAYYPDTIVVGLDGFPLSGLKNIYIPFFNRDEIYMPYLKPRFVYRNGKLRLIPAAPSLLAGMFNTNELLDYLKENDFYYYQFEIYHHFGLLPFSNSIRFLYSKILNSKKYFSDDPETDLLMEALMTEMAMEARKNGASIVFLLLPDQATVYRSGVRRYLPDLYGQKIKYLRSKGFTLIDAREILLESGKGGDELFEIDHKHYTSVANRLIAEKLSLFVSDKATKMMIKNVGEKERNF